MDILYLECAMGAAGDMLTAALYELLEDKEGFLRTMNGLGLPGVRVEARSAVTCGISGTHMQVTVRGEEEREPQPGEHHHHSHLTPGRVAELIEGLSLPRPVRDDVHRVYGAIARAEALVHGRPVEEVHFHEVGALDAIADVAGACLALHLLRPGRVVASPVHVGSGTVRCAHGVLPVPAPAAARLLEGVPVYGGSVRGELCTPTGAALLKTFAREFGPMPVMTLQKTGVGVGSKSFEQANCLRAFLGTAAEQTGGEAGGGDRPNGEITELVCNLDDMTAEALAFSCARLLELGALDVYTLPGTMKKGRPGHVLVVLCDPAREAEMAGHILAQTSTIGLRVRRCGKYFLTPGAGQVQTQWGPVRLKLARGYGVSRVKPEFEDAAALARAHGVPVQAVVEEALRNLES